MVKKRITEALASQDTQTKQWRMRFACARMAYEEGNLREAENLLLRLQEPAEHLHEHAFAVNTVRVGLAAVQISEGRMEEARTNLHRTISALEGSTDPALQEVYGVALRFFAQLLIDLNEQDQAERELQKSISTFQDIGPDGAVQLAYSMSDLAGLYVMQGRLEEANQLITGAMQLLALTVGSEDKEYARADILHSLCQANDEDLLEIAEACGIKLQYQFGAQHPTMIRALNRYVKALKERGDVARLENAKQTFAGFGKVLDAKGRAG